MLCLKKKKFWGSSSSSSYGPQSQSKTFGMEQKGSGSGTSSIEEANKRGSRDPSRSNGMAPPPTAAVPAVNPLVREVTEDTPPDLLEGTMDLLVILPSGKTVQTTVDRKTPVMDLLVHTATANKINPAGHIVQVRNERGIEMPYKPSTPIGALDTTTIEIVPKNRVNEYIIVKQPVKVANQPFETTFRLQVHLPRNQLYVMRISPKTLLDEILREVCQEKNLDINKYEIRHPVNLDQRLSPSLTVGDTGLQELTIVSKNSKINSSVSTADILAIQQQNEDCRGKGCLDGSFKHSRSSVGDSSVSSESTGSAGSGRGISPCRSEDSRSISPLPLIRPKTLIQSRPSYISTCSSSGNSSAGLHRMNTVDGCTMSRQLSQSPQPMQAPPRTKKRAAPKPPSPAVSTLSVNVNCSTGAPSNISTPSPISEKNPILCSTPINGSSNGNSNSNGNGIGNANGNDNVSLSNGSKSPEKLQELRPTPRKKEAPREPPSSKHHTPLSHHQSLPLNHHSRHSSGNVEHHQETGACGPQDQNDSRQLDRLETPTTQKMSGKHSMSSSMTNLTSVSSVSSTSLASSTGGSKKRRAPKPPALGAVKTPSQIEEERETTTAESTLRSGVEVDVKIGSHLPNQQPSSTRNQKSVVGEVASDDDSKEMKVSSPSPMSSLSSRSESTTPSPIPPQQLSPKSNNSVSVLNKMKERHSSLNINQDSGPEKVGVHDEYGSESRGSNSRSSTPSSCNNLGNNVIGATSHPSPDSVRSRKNRVSVVVEEASPTASSRPPISSSNTQEKSSSSSPKSSARPMPMPLPRRRVAPSENSPSEQSGKVVTARRAQPQHQNESESQSQIPPVPKPKPRPRSDRQSVDLSLPSSTKPQVAPKPEEALAAQSSFGQMRNPLAKYGVKVLPDEVLKERADRLKKKASEESLPSPTVHAANTNNAFEDALTQNKLIPPRPASKSSYSSSDDFSETGSIGSFNSSITKSRGSSELSKTPPSLSKTDYMSQGSVRSLKQLISAEKSTSAHYNDKTDSNSREGYESDDLLEDENLDFFEPVQQEKAKSSRIFVKSNSAKDVPSTKSRRPTPAPFNTATQIVQTKGAPEIRFKKQPTEPASTTKSRVSSSVSAFEDLDLDQQKRRFVKQSGASPGAVSESGFGRASSQGDNAEDGDAGKLNRWQNMVSLNEIETQGKSARNARTNKLLDPAIKPLLLRGDFQHSKIHLSDESHNNENEVTCHSSESEASYTDSGVPATETVTPSPVNLDDVILDHDHEDHSGSHQEKFSSEDGDTRKHSSRRSSLESEHSNDWMNSMQSKLNKEEEDVEKMFEAALTHPGEESSGFESATLLDDDDAEKESDAAILAARNSNNKKDEDEAGEKEMIVTTVQLHHIPSTHQSKDEEPENDEVSHPEPEIVASSNNQQVRKLSKSESFSHHSEFDEATQKRKVYSSARSVNNLKLSSQNSGSATELTQGLSSEERENPGTIIMEQSSLEHKVQSTGPVLNKTTSLGTLSVESSNKDGNVTMDMYRKQLEMQFEQWKQEFIKNHQGNASDVPSDKAIMAEVAKKIQVKQSEDLKQKSVELTEPLKEEEVKQRSESRNSEVLRASSTEAPGEIEILGETVGTACSEEKPIKDIKDESHKTKIEDVSSSRDTVANEPVKISIESSIEIETKEESAPEENMKGADDFPVELRRKTATKQASSPAPVYHYSGPPTIKMASWNERPRRAVSVKDDDDYIMGFGQQDASNKPSVASRIHSFHGAGPVVQVENSMKSKRESSPNPSIPVVKGWSAAINAPSTVSGSVRSVLSTWKQKMEETEKEKNKPREGPPAEIDIYGGSENSENQLKPKIANGTTFKKEPSVTVTTVAPNKSTSAAPVSVSVEEQQTKPVVITAKPTINTVKQEKFQTLGSSFRSEKPVSFSISPMESNTLPRNKPVSAAKSFTDTVDAKPSAATSVIEVNGSADSGSTTGTMEQRKKFFQGVKPVENGKEAPVPATNMKNNIAAIQKVFEKQRVTKMQQMGSQQSLHSEGTVSPVPSLQRNDSLESRHSLSTTSTNNNINNKQVLQRQNSLESHSSDSSSVVLRVSSGKVSPQLSSTEMVQKLFGRPNSFNIDAARRTPSPISSTTSTLSSSTSYERFTPSPTVVDGPNNSVRITTGGYKPQPQNQQTSNIRSVGNKAIIIVNGADTPSAKSAEDRDKRAMMKQSSTVNDNIILESGRKLQPKKSLVSASYVSAIAQDSPPKKTTAAPVPPPPAPAPTPVKPTQLSFSQKSGRVQANGTTPPPPPPPPVDIVPLKPVATSPSSNTLRNSKPSTPSTPTSPDPRSEIFNAIKNSNGNFGLRKTGSSILMK